MTLVRCPRIIHFPLYVFPGMLKILSSDNDLLQVLQGYDFNSIGLQSQNHSVPQKLVSSSTQNDNEHEDSGLNNDEPGELKKLDSFGRWMDKEIGGDCDDSLMASDSANYWSTLDTETDDKEVSSLSHHMQLDMDSLAPSLSQEQLFSIVDFSPDWAYSGVETKVCILAQKNYLPVIFCESTFPFVFLKSYVPINASFV